MPQGPVVPSAPMRRAPEGMAGLAKGLAIIEAFERQPRLTAADAARAVDLTRAATRRCLNTLTQLGYLRYDGKYFSPSPRLLRLGYAYLSAATLPQQAQPFLDALRDASGESASLAVLDGDAEVVFVARATATRLVSTGVLLGTRLPSYGLATGRVLLGKHTDAALAALISGRSIERRTPKTLVDSPALMRAIRTAAETGFCVDDEELELGLRAVAVPVPDAAGRPLAALSLSTSSARLTVDAMVDVFVPLLREQARRLAALRMKPPL